MENNRPKTSMRKIYPINKHKLNYVTLRQQNNSQLNTFFVQEKETGDKYFRSTRVGSCRKIIIRNNLPYALTYRVKNPHGGPMNHFKYTLKQLPKNPSNYFLDFCIKRRENHLGMDKKPLVPYNPYHSRSQLPNDLSFRVIRNYSAFDIGRESLINRKQWISTYRDSYRTISVKRISNPGILSSLAKRRHYKLNNIEYA